jgi:CBS domain-containing protein
MNLEAIAIVAAVPVSEPESSKDGSLVGVVTANAVSDAMKEAGYIVIHQSELKKLGDGMRAVLAILDGE